MDEISVNKKINYWDSIEDYVVFKIANETYAIRLKYIKEVVKKGELLCVPDLPDYITGLTNIRGEIFPVFDLKNKFSLENTKKYGKYSVIIILVFENDELALIADSIIDIYNIPQENLKPHFLETEQKKFITFETSLEDFNVKVLNLNELFKLKKLY